MVMLLLLRVMVVISGRGGRRSGRGHLLLMMMTHVVAARRQVQVEAGGRRVLTAAGLGAGGVAAGAAVGLLGRQAHRRLRRVHGPRADERALHPAQLHAPFGVSTQMRAISAGVMSDPSRQKEIEREREASSVCPSTLLYRFFVSSFAPYLSPWDLSSAFPRTFRSCAFQDIPNNNNNYKEISRDTFFFLRRGIWSFPSNLET